MTTTLTRDKLNFFIPCRRISPTDNCNCQSCHQEEASGLKKKCRRCKFSHSLSSLSFIFFIFSMKCFSFDFFVAALTLVQIKVNYLFRRKIYFGDTRKILPNQNGGNGVICYNQIVSSFFFKVHDTNKYKDS